MAKTLRNAGQVNLKGKQSRLMRCGCCECRNLKPGILEKMIAKEVKAQVADLRERVSRVEGHDDWI